MILRGRIRKLGVELNFNVLVEDTEDTENGVRFAVLDRTHAERIEKYLVSIIDDISVTLALSRVVNPILSKLKVNDESRYSL